MEEVGQAGVRWAGQRGQNHTAAYAQGRQTCAACTNSVRQ